MSRSPQPQYHLTVELPIYCNHPANQNCVRNISPDCNPKYQRGLQNHSVARMTGHCSYRGKKKRRTQLIRSKCNGKRNANVPMLYNNICKMPPTTERPVMASLTPYEPASFFLVAVGLELPPLEVPLGPRVVGSSVADTHFSFPWTTLPANLSKPEQSIWDVL